jgi:hypothetical protein
MHDSGHQTRHFILKNGYLFHQAARFAGLVQSSLCLTLHQGPSRSEILDKYSVHRQEEQGGEGAPELNALAGDETRSRFGDPLVCASWKPKEGKRKQLRNPTQLNIP